MEKANAVVATYTTHDQAQQAVKDLQKAGIDMRTLSIAARDMHTEEHVVGYYNAADRIRYWGKLGAFWGGIWGLLFGSAAFAIPGVGPLLVAGPLVGWIVAGLEGAVAIGGIGVVGAGLASIGIPGDSIVEYQTALTSGCFLLLVHGSPDMVAKARSIIGGTTHGSHTVHGERVFATNHGPTTPARPAFAYHTMGIPFS